jgi:hypothetical protein
MISSLEGFFGIRTRAGSEDAYCWELSSLRNLESKYMAGLMLALGTVFKYCSYIKQVVRLISHRLRTKAKNKGERMKCWAPKED